MGAGIAGASAALQLSQHQKVLLIEAKKTAAGASGVAGGLFSPMIALRGRPVWHIDEAIDAFHQQLALASASHLFDHRGVIRPAKDEQQVAFFKQSAEMCPRHAEWWSADETKERFPKVHAPLGTLFAKTGGAFSTTVFCQQMVAAAVKNGATFIDQQKVLGWGATPDKAWISVANDNASDEISEKHARIDIMADRVVLAIGRAFFDQPFQDLDLHAVKGQTIRIKRPAWLNYDDLPPASSQGYIIPEEHTLAIGSSFEHTFDDDAISRSVSQLILKKVSALIPRLIESPIIEEHVGIRVTVPKIRLPMVGSYRGRIWVFTGFGSKGLLLAPMLASQLHDYFQQPALIPQEIKVRVKT
ncbi:MAG: NAD(P)/FAD-dependent oxidoreductase [Rhodothermales bacterium]